ncbi:hypothetical protein CL621_00505 [archaeon]|nr:hypothetical protein [archaeon]|tara:strand:+ start:3396 stop:5195 length:1800 start_codon:yes stop_codon:yes gene_type:complete
MLKRDLIIALVFLIIICLIISILPEEVFAGDGEESKEGEKHSGQSTKKSGKYGGKSTGSGIAKPKTRSYSDSSRQSENTGSKKRSISSGGDGGSSKKDVVAKASAQAAAARAARSACRSDPCCGSKGPYCGSCGWTQCLKGEKHSGPTKKDGKYNGKSTGSGIAKPKIRSYSDPSRQSENTGPKSKSIGSGGESSPKKTAKFGFLKCGPDLEYDSGTGECIEKSCNKNMDCSSGLACMDHKCIIVGCSSEEGDWDCPAGYECNDGIFSGGGGVCERIWWYKCDDKSDCSLGEVCAGNLCIKKECDDDSFCSTGEICAEGLCLKKECDDDSFCSTGTICEKGLCIPKPCYLSPDCPAGFDCVADECERALCLSAETCPGGFACLGGYCYEKECDSETPCPGGFACREYTCVKRELACKSKVNCLTGEECFMGACVKKECDGETICSPGLTCIGYQCIKRECRSYKECPWGELCSSEGICFEKECSSKTPCSPGFACEDYQCIPFAGLVKCESTAECSSGLDCVGELCIEPLEEAANTLEIDTNAVKQGEKLVFMVDPDKNGVLRDYYIYHGNEIKHKGDLPYRENIGKLPETVSYEIPSG